MSPPLATNVSAVLLAAGGGSRLGGDKMRLPYKGTTLFQRAVSPIIECPLIGELVVVVRPDALWLLEEVDCTPRVNDHWQEGMGSSLSMGALAVAREADALLVCLADMPEITADLLSELIEAFHRCGETILTPYCEGRAGHPVIFDAAWRRQLERLSGDVGARHLLRESPDVVAQYETDNRAVLFDVDRPEDVRLRRIQTRDAAHASVVATALEEENIFHTTISLDADVVGGKAVVEYHAFDEARVAEVCDSLKDGDA